VDSTPDASHDAAGSIYSCQPININKTMTTKKQQKLLCCCIISISLYFISTNATPKAGVSSVAHWRWCSTTPLHYYTFYIFKAI
jgi:hypothetical protein